MPLHNHLTKPVEWDFGTETYVKLPGRTVNIWGRDLSGNSLEIFTVEDMYGD